MKLEMRDGALTATAESVRDARKLLALDDSNIKKARVVLAERKAIVQEKRKYTHKVSCPICGKRVKRLSAHVAYNHKEPVPVINRAYEGVV
jgi:hypothetical protein